MGLKIFSVDELTAQLIRVGENSGRAMLKVARAEAEQIRDLAREFAPHDEGKLEAAIKVREAAGQRDARGRFARRRLEVYVDPTMPGSGGLGALSVGDYAYLMHEGLGPFGDGTYNRREGSLAKDGGRGVVGGKFMERALNARRSAIQTGIDEALESVMRNA